VNTDTQTNRTIAIIAPNWLGDAVMSLPAVGMLGAALGANVSVIAPEATARVYWGLSDVDELVVLGKRGPTRGIRARARYLRKTRPAAAVMMPPSFSSAAGPWLAGVPVRVGYRSDRRQMALTHPVELRAARDEHLSRDFLRLGTTALECLALSPPDSYETPSIRVADADYAGLERVFEGAVHPYVVVVPGATYGPAKSWPWRRYREAVGILGEEHQVVLAGTEAERPMCERIAEGSGSVVNLAGKTPLGTFLALLSRARVVLANDSGSPHLAASVGTPVVVLFGSTSPQWTAPIGPAVEVVRHPVECSPCFRKTCPTQLECFDGITVDAVVEKTRRALTTV